MENSKLIAEFIIPEYLREVQVSKKQRPKYYTWDADKEIGSTFIGGTIKSGSKKLLQKYINQDYRNAIIENNGNINWRWLKYPYCIVAIKGKKVTNIFYPNDYVDKMRKKGTFYQIKSTNIKLTNKEHISDPIFILINIETKQKVIANETQAGKPKRIIIKGQDMYSGVLNEFTRAKIVKELKEDYYKKLNNFIYGSFKVGNLPILTFPVRIEMELIDTIKNYYDRTKEGNGIRWDVGNRVYPYLKTFVDFLIDNNILPDDDRTHVEGESYFFTPCEKHEDRKLIFRIYKV